MFISDITEAISLTKYSTKIGEFIKQGIRDAFSIFAMADDFYEEQKKDYNDPNASSRPFLDLVTASFEEMLQQKIAWSLQEGLKKKLNFKLYKVKFEPLDNADAHVDSDDSIVINKKTVKKFATKLIEELEESTINNMDEMEHKSMTFFKLAKGIGDGSRYLKLDDLIYRSDLQDDIDNLSSTMVHELTHIVQHSSQSKYEKEYRSYLDKKKNEFWNLAVTPNSERSEEESKRYDVLYYSSPQEIAAFSQQFALDLVNAYGIDEYDTIEGLQLVIKELDSREITSTINRKMVSSFNKPDSKKEYAVWKRYLKLIYQEFMRRISEKMTELKNKKEELKKSQEK